MRAPWAWGELAGTIAPAAPPGYDGRSLARGVMVDAAPETVWSWLRQLELAPYSYDLLDNRGHRSPQHLTLDLPELAPGVRMMKIFTVLSVDPGRAVTMAITEPGAVRMFGPVALTYQVVPLSPDRTALRADLFLAPAPGRVRRLHQTVIAWGDVPMMRKQLLNLKALAEGRVRGRLLG